MKMTALSQIYTKLSLLALSAVVSTSSWAAGPQCRNLFPQINSPLLQTKKEILDKTIEKQKDLVEKQAAEGYSSLNIYLHTSMKTILTRYPELKAHKNLISSIEQLVAKEELSSYHEILLNSLQPMIEKPKTVSAESFLPKLKEKILAQTSKFMPVAEATERIQLLEKEDINLDQLMQALGKMTPEQSLQALIGKKGIHDIDPDSMVGRYLTAASAKKENAAIKTFVGNFLKGPGYEGHGNEKKLYVAVDRATLKTLSDIIGSNPHLLIHNHTPLQDTLDMYYQSRKVGYSGGTYVDASLTQNAHLGTVWPVIALSSTEASNTKNYFELGKLNQKYAKYPWGFQKYNSDRVLKLEDNYCTHGGYTSCTHWIGEMPIGEKTVQSYSMPGNTRDGYTDSGTDHFYENPSELRTKKIGTYNSFYTPKKEHIIVGHTTRVDRLARMVWKEKEGHEQLWSMIGDKNAEALSQGEWANPGWVLYSLLNRTQQERVPVVFIMTKDATVELNQESLDHLKNKISPY